ncbi:DNA cytosine methyltransferase [Bauldia litoralis]|uniref:DNA cytosine methyltransferase n=1 Tax=Bauldia litoralis TaxID=665467 RepID=UPI003264AA92
MNRPLAIDLYCGLGGWTEGLLAEGYDVVGFDIERHVYGEHRYPAQLVVQDVLTLHGSQFKNADLIVASPPCQEYSYMAMPWKLAKAKAAAIRADTTGAELERLNRLFNACFRIQKEASIAAGRHVPMVVENVRGAIPWVGRSRWNFGSFHLWGDVPALMPMTLKASKVPGFRFDGSGKSFQTSVEAGRKQPGNAGPRANGKGDAWFQDGAARHGSKSPARKAASAMIAKIPLPLSQHIAAVYREGAA